MLMRPILEVAKSLGLDPADVEQYGNWKAKLALQSFSTRPRRGKLVLVSAITPTPAGEGKTTTSVGLAQGLGENGGRGAAAPGGAGPRRPGGGRGGAPHERWRRGGGREGGVRGRGGAAGPEPRAHVRHEGRRRRRRRLRGRAGGRHQHALHGRLPRRLERAQPARGAGGQRAPPR